MSDLSQRRLQPEIMDQPGLDPGQHRQALHGLRRINFWSGSAGILWRPLSVLAREVAPRPLRVLDLASGGGDVPIRLWHKARRAGLNLSLEGCDVSPVAVEFATEQARQRGAGIRFFVADTLSDSFSVGYDVIVNSLFLHHLREEVAVSLLRKAGQAAPAVLVNDLRRSWTGLLAARVVTRLLSLSHVVHVDGPRSVEGAYTMEEVRHLAECAGLHGATIQPRWPYRFLLSWRRA
jgi:2-polyprenyl-3-methyl-5-hydroxy-6-metoxy-1,4-benzoquinol methylase